MFICCMNAHATKLSCILFIIPPLITDYPEIKYLLNDACFAVIPLYCKLYLVFIDESITTKYRLINDRG